MKHRLLDLIHEKEKALGRRLTIRQIAKGAEVSERLIYRWLDPDEPTTRYDSVVIEKFCEYFGVEVGDLLVYEHEEDPA